VQRLEHDPNVSSALLLRADANLTIDAMAVKRPVVQRSKIKRRATNYRSCEAHGIART
jgi:hypothetical protein